MVDGDGTYDPATAAPMIEMLLDGVLDMVTGCREVHEASEAAFRAGHRIGNRFFSGSVRRLFKSDCTDVLSGYRVLSRRFVKSFPSVASGFEIEVEMTAHASLLRLPVGELPTAYVDRTAGSRSKLRTYRDGVRIALALFRLFRSFSPSRFFGSLAALAGVLAALLLTSVLGPPSGVSRPDLGVAFLILSALLLSVGVILNAASRQRVEVLRIRYLGIDATRRAA
jgi:hypothetical protein